MSESKLDITSREPLYQQLYRLLKERLISGFWAPGSMLPSITQLAEEFGVSIITVENALKKLIANGYCYRRPKKGTFAFQRSAIKAMPENLSRTIIIHAPASVDHDQMLLHFTQAIHNEARLLKIDILHIFGNALEERLEDMKKNQEIYLLGVIMLQPHDLKFPRRLALNNPDVSFVNLNYQFENFDITPPNLLGVFSEEFGGAYAMTSYILSKGFNRIGIVTCDHTDINYKLRQEGYVTALEHFGIRFREELVATVNVSKAAHTSIDFLQSLGVEGTKKLLPHVPDAIFFFNDVMAAGAIEYLNGKHPDKKIYIAGHDNFIPQLSSTYHFPTVKVDVYRMGKLAVRLLTDELPPQIKCFCVPAKLLQR